MTSPDHQDVTAVIVNYGNRKDTAELAGRLEHQVENIVVVDNSNEIDPGAGVFSRIDILQPGRNIGYGAAVNAASGRVKSRWLLVLNPDVRLKRNCLKYLLRAAQELHAPLCGPRFYWDDECTLQLPPALGHPLWLLSDRYFPNRKLWEQPDLGTLSIDRHERFWSEKSPFSEPVLSGACLLIDLDWFKQNHMAIFDEDFFLYYEDTDLCGRLMRKGVMPLCVPDANVVHYWNQSPEPPEGKTGLMEASEEIFLRKYYPNGTPPLPPARDLPEFEELGEFGSPPALILPGRTHHLDIAVQPDFLVFARTPVTQPTFTFKASKWRRIRNGRYYLRAADESGNFLHHWSWHKESSSS